MPERSKREDRPFVPEPGLATWQEDQGADAGLEQDQRVRLQPEGSLAQVQGSGVPNVRNGFSV